MKWGTFDIPGGVHACPCTEGGHALEPHRLELDCECHPRIEQAPGERPIILHHDGH